MERTPRHSLIKRLQTEMPRGAPFGVDALEALGITPKLAARYVEHGWLIRLGRGVYAFPGDELTAHGSVKLLQTRVKDLHVGGKSALALQGVRHNLAPRDTLVLWGEAKAALPEWFTSRYPARYASAKLFDWPDAKLAKLTLTTPPGVTDGLQVSTPERAAMEMLYEVGTNQGLEEARNLFEGLRNLRKEVTGRLLACCTSVKAVRLFLTWSRQTNLMDVDTLREHHRLRVGSEARWMGRLKDGTLLTLKQYG